MRAPGRAQLLGGATRLSLPKSSPIHTRQGEDNLIADDRTESQSTNMSMKFKAGREENLSQRWRLNDLDGRIFYFILSVLISGHSSLRMHRGTLSVCPVESEVAGVTPLPNSISEICLQARYP